MLLKVPGAQVLGHTSLTVVLVLEKRPTGQSRQLKSLVRSTNLPAVHDLTEQLEAASLDTKPRLQVEHTVAPAEENEPAMQDVQVVASDSPEK